MEAPESIRGEKLKCATCGNSQKVTGENPELMRLLGNLEPICPYCSNPLKKKPKRRSKCPHCGNYFLVRTRVQDRQQVLVTEEEAEEISKQYYEGYGRDPENWLKEKCEVWKEKRDELKIQSREYAKTGRWGLYRNCRYTAGDTLRLEACFLLSNKQYSKEEKYKRRAEIRISQAIRVYLEVVLFDLNRASNNNKFNPPKDKIKFWDVAPAVMNWVAELTSKLNFYREDIQQIFYETADLYKKYSFPLSTSEAWQRFDEALNEYDKMYPICKEDE